LGYLERELIGHYTSGDAGGPERGKEEAARIAIAAAVDAPAQQPATG
jgi:hypothetical protein